MRKVLVSIFLITTSLAAPAQMKTVVYFDVSSGILDASSKRALDTLIPVLKKAGRYKISIHGYCDCNGTHPSDTALANDRANSVFNHLKERGIPEDKMTVIGHAEIREPPPGSDPLGKSKYRRTEVLITFLNLRPIIADTSVHEKPDTTRIKPNPPPAKPVKPPVVKTDPASSLEGMKVGQKLPIKKINFVNDRAIILPESMPALEQLLKYMQDNPALEIKLSGYVCCTPDLALSIARAKSVYDYLVKNNISFTRISYEGFSNRVPLMPNDNNDSIAAKVNRRVEVTIMKK